jgi:uncharacterized low-complexity protein
LPDNDKKLESYMSKLKIAIGAAVVTGLGVAGVANADVNEGLFSMDELSSGYLTAGGHEGSCGEGKCGADKEGKDGEGSCGDDKKGEESIA